MAKITEIWFVLLSISPFSKGNKETDTCRGCVGTLHSEVLILMFFSVRFALSQGAGMAEGSRWCHHSHHSGFNQHIQHIDCNAPLLSTKEKPLWFVQSDIVRFIPKYDRCVFLSVVFRCWHNKVRNDSRIMQVFNHLWISMTNIWLYLTNRRAVSLYKLRNSFEKCKHR